MAIKGIKQTEDHKLKRIYNLCVQVVIVVNLPKQLHNFMKNFLNKFKYFIIGGLVVLSSTVFAVQISVPSAPISSLSGGFMLQSLSTGQWAATSTANLFVGSITATTTNATSTFMGVVGIGTNYPTQVNTNSKLTVAGAGAVDVVASTTDNTTLSTAILEAYAPGSRVFIGAHGTNQVTTQYGITVGGWGELGAINSSSGISNGLLIGTRANVAPVVFGTGAGERIRITGPGFVGIGTTTPSLIAALTLSSTTRPQLSFSSGAGFGQVTERNSYGTFYWSTTTVDGLATSSISAMFLNPNGFLTLPALSGVGCAQWTAVGLLTNTGTACGSGSGGAFPFTPTTNFNVNTSATSTPLWLRGSTISLMASSTSYFDNLITTNSATSSIGNFGGILDASTFPGSDIGAKINAAYAALPATGGNITVPSGTFSFSTPIVFGTNNKFFHLMGQGQGTVLNYTGTATSTTINVNTSVSGNYGISNIKLVGPSSAGTTVGIQMGGSNGAANVTLSGLQVRGFGKGLSNAANTYLTIVQNSTFNFNGQNLYISQVSNGGEEMRFINDVFADSATVLNCVFIEQSADVGFWGTSFDDCQVHIGDTVNMAAFDYVHFENPGGNAYGTYDFLKVDSSPATHVAVSNSHFDNTNWTSSVPNEFIKTASVVTVSDTSFNRVGSSLAIPYLVTTDESDAYVEFRGIRLISGPYTNIWSGSIAPVVYDVVDNLSFDIMEKFGVGTTSPDLTTTIQGTSNYGTMDVVSLAANSEAGINFRSANQPLSAGWFLGKGAGGSGTSFGLFKDTSNKFIVDTSGNFGIASDTPGSLLALGADAVGINFGLGSSTFSTTGGINLAKGCYAIRGVCISGGGGGGTVTSVTGTFPISSSGGNTPSITFTGLGTSSPAVIGNVPYFSGVNTFANVATGTITCTGTASCGAGSYVIGSNLTITGSGTDPFTHPFVSGSASTSIFALGTSTMSALSQLTLASSTAPQLALSAGAGIAQWAFRNAGGNLFLSTTTVDGLATSTTAGLAITSTGNVGVGTPIPSALLQVGNILDGNVRFAQAGQGLGEEQFYYLNESIPRISLGRDVFGGGLAGLQFKSTSGGTVANGGVGFGSPALGMLSMYTSDNTALAEVMRINRGVFSMGTTTTSIGELTISTSTAPQLSLSAGAGLAQWVFRNTGDTLVLSTTTVDGLATTTIPAVSFSKGQILIPDGTGAAPSLSFLDDTNNGIGSPANDILAIYTNGLERMRFDDGTGAAAMGTTTPGKAILSIGTSTAPQLALSDNTAGDAQWTMRNAGGNFYLATTSVSGLATTTTAAMTLTSSGKPGISISSSTPFATLAVNPLAGNFSNQFVVGSSTATNFRIDNSGFIFAPNTSSSNGAQTGYWCYDANAQWVRDSVVCIAVSALRFKQDIKSDVPGLDELLKLNPISYKLKPSYNTLFKDNPNYNGTQYSLIADDVQKIDPRLVTVETSTTTFEGKTYPPGTVHGLSSYENWVAIFTKSIQDLNAKVDGTKKSMQDNWQWLAIALLVIWNLYLTFRKRNV